MRKGTYLGNEILPKDKWQAILGDGSQKFLGGRPPLFGHVPPGGDRMVGVANGIGQTFSIPAPSSTAILPTLGRAFLAPQSHFVSCNRRTLPPPPPGQHQSDTRWQTHSVAHTSLALRPLAPKRWSASGPSSPLFLAGAGLLSTTTWKSSRPTPSAAGCGRCWRAGQGQEAVAGVQVGGVAMLLKSGQPLLTPRSLILATPPRMAGMNGIRPFLQEYSIALAGPFPACQWGPPLTPFPPNRPCGSDPVTPWDPRKGQRFGFGPFFGTILPQQCPTISISANAGEGAIFSPDRFGPRPTFGPPRPSVSS